LLSAAVDTIVVLNRTPERAEALVQSLGGIGPTELRVLPLDADRLVTTVHTADLLVNTTTVGMWPNTGVSIWPESVEVPQHLTVYDLVYNPLATRLLQQARAAGATAIDGLGMLARQGALALGRWLNVSLDIDAATTQMRHVCEKALRSQSADMPE
jgi:shikimate dehydrogenase